MNPGKISNPLLAAAVSQVLADIRYKGERRRASDLAKGLSPDAEAAVIAKAQAKRDRRAAKRIKEAENQAYLKETIEWLNAPLTPEEEAAFASASDVTKLEEF